MKTKFLAVLAAAVILFSGANAQAAVQANPYQLQNGDTGVVFDSSYTYLDYVGPLVPVVSSFSTNGFLAGMSRLTLTYELTNPAIVHSSVNVYAAEPGKPNKKLGHFISNSGYGTDNYHIKDPAMLAMAALWNLDLTGGTIVISNYANEIIEITSSLLAIVFDSGTLKVSAAVTAIPLPAALPLFGLGLASLAGYGLRKRKTA